MAHIFETIRAIDYIICETIDDQKLKQHWYVLAEYLWRDEEKDYQCYCPETEESD